MSKNGKTIINLLALATIMAVPPMAFAQQDTLLSDTETILNSDPIDIDGVTYEPEEKTPEEMLEEAQIKAETANAKAISNEISKLKVPSKQVKEIKKEQAKTLSDKIAKLFGGTGSSGSTSGSASSTAAPVAQSETKVESAVASESTIKIIPSFGVVNIKGDGIDFESNVNFGLALEAMVSKRVAIGLSVGYANLSMTDVSSNSAYYNYSGAFTYNSYGNYYSNGLVTTYNNGVPVTYYSNGLTYSSNPYTSGYMNTYGQNGREMSYNQLILELSSKFFFAVESRIRPYLGLGVGYNRTNLKYDDSATYTDIYNVSYGNEEFTSNYISGSAMLGADVNFTSNFGLNLELKYAKGLTDGFGTSSIAQNSDQRRLDSVGARITDSDFLSVIGGVFVGF